jgi:hypothetical protein
MKKVLLPIAYLPPIAWFQHALQADEVWIEQYEHYTKQTYRNRCKIVGAHGIQDLSIPTQHQSQKIKISELQSDENIHWKRNHWLAIRAAYGKSPFFVHYAHLFEPYFLPKESVNVFEFNFGLIQTLLKCFKTPISLNLSREYEITPQDKEDLRNAFHGKGLPHASELLFEKKYYQSFPEKFDFFPNASAIDLLFHQGPAAVSFLK